MGFNQYNLENHLPCLMGPKFYASEASGSGEKTLIFPGVFLRFKSMASLEGSILDTGVTI